MYRAAGFASHPATELQLQAGLIPPGTGGHPSEWHLPERVTVPKPACSQVENRGRAAVTPHSDVPGPGQWPRASPGLCTGQVTSKGQLLTLLWYPKRLAVQCHHLVQDPSELVKHLQVLFFAHTWVVEPGQPSLQHTHYDWAPFRPARPRPVAACRGGVEGSGLCFRSCSRKTQTLQLEEKETKIQTSCPFHPRLPFQYRPLPVLYMHLSSREPPAGDISRLQGASGPCPELICTFIRLYNPHPRLQPEPDAQEVASRSWSRVRNKLHVSSAKADAHPVGCCTSVGGA